MWCLRKVNSESYYLKVAQINLFFCCRLFDTNGELKEMFSLFRKRRMSDLIRSNALSNHAMLVSSWSRNCQINGAFYTGSAQKILSWTWAEPELSLQCEQGSAQIFSAGLEFLIGAAGPDTPLLVFTLDEWLSSGSAWNLSRALRRASARVKCPINMLWRGTGSVVEHSLIVWEVQGSIHGPVKSPLPDRGSWEIVWLLGESLQ